jgi:hypothetical protein
VISLPASTDATPGAPVDPRATPDRFDLLYRIAGLIVGVLLAIATGVAEAVLTPTYIGSVRSPLAPILALVGNAGIVWFVWTVARRAGLALIPGAVWFVVMIIASSKTSEGDLIITGTWVGLLTLLLGSLGWAGAGYVTILRRATIPHGAPMLNRTAEAAQRAKPASGKPGGQKPAPGAKPGNPKSTKATSSRRPAN